MSYLTQQKQVLGRVFEGSERPLTALEVHALARRELPSLGIATVYRAIKQFVAEGAIRAVDIPGAAPHYECATRQHHHFFLCNQCSRIFNLSGCIPGVKALAPSGFRVKQHEIVLYGECASCAGGA